VTGILSRYELDYLTGNVQLKRGHKHKIPNQEKGREPLPTHSIVGGAGLLNQQSAENVFISEDKLCLIMIQMHMVDGT